MFNKSLMTLAIAAVGVATSPAWAAVTAEEAKQLGTTLTLVGAEKAGNKEGTIPAFTGGLTKVPEGMMDGNKRKNPFGDEKPRLVITGKDVAAHADKLTEGTKELLKRHPTMRVDVYPTHRTVGHPKFFLDNTVKNATATKAIDGGLGFENALPGVPFPIPKTGNEAMWNHLLGYLGLGIEGKYDSYNVDSAGVATLATTGNVWYAWPLFDPKSSGNMINPSDPYWFVKLQYTAPARRAGEALLVHDFANPLQNPRRAWQYLPGQRRVKAAPDVAYDTPNPGSAGNSTYDDASIFNGAMDRYDFKLVGKKEMIVPYSGYQVSQGVPPLEFMKPNHVDPNVMRWELHRVWVVEATLKPGKRHIYSKRVFYLDEDSWLALASDQYDGSGKLYRAGFAPIWYAWDAGAPFTAGTFTYDFAVGSYSANGMFGGHSGVKFMKQLPPPTFFTPDALASTGVR